MSRHGTGTGKRRELIDRTGIVFPAAGVAAIVVAGVTVAAYLFGPGSAGDGGADAAFEAVQGSKAISMLEQERQQFVEMDAAVRVLSTASKPVVVSPDQVADDGGGGTGTDVVVAAPPDPDAARQIGYDMLPAYGFSQSTQWNCLDDLWNRESEWIYDAENAASGAYGIPQSLPAGKMAAFGADYLTDPTTQIRWGLWYIQQVYGTPCNAWAHELADGSY